MRKLQEMKIGEDVSFYAMVEALQKRYTPNKSSYYSVTITDGDSSIDARVWDTNLIESNGVMIDKVYFFSAHINEYANKKQFVVNAIREATTDEVDINDFIRTAPTSGDEIKNGIKTYIRKINNEILKKLVTELIKEVAEKYFSYPAAMTMHHNYVNGLAYHTYSMLRMSDAYLEVYKGMNSDLLYAGILLHDIGKTKELSGTTSPVYTSEGNLLGHIVIGLQMIEVCATKLGINGTEEVLVLEHLIASHHGELEYGSPKEPDILEAYALHFLDLADSKLASICPEVQKTEPGNMTGPITSLNRKTIYVHKIK